MTLPAIGIIGLTFLCLLIFFGIALLIICTNDNLSFRLRETLNSYRSPKKVKEPKSKRKKSKKTDFHDMYGVPHHGSMQQMQHPGQMPHQSHRENVYHQHTAQHHSSSHANQQMAYPGTSKQAGPSQPQYGNQPVGYNGARPKNAGDYPKGQSMFYPGSPPHSISSGASTPQDFAAAEKKGILKHASGTAKSSNGNGHQAKHKSVIYEDQVHTVEIA